MGGSTQSLFLAFGFLISCTMAVAAQYYSITPGATVQINEHGLCRNVTNNTGLSIFVPTNSSGEWNNFLNNFAGATKTPCSLRFIYEYGGNASGDNTTTLGAVQGGTWDGTEKLSYLAVGQSATSVSRSFSTFLFDGVAPAWQQAAVDNGDAEHISGGIGIFHVNPADTAQTIQYNMSGSVSKQIAYFRIIGGAGNLSVVYSDFRGNGPAWPYAYNIPGLEVGDIVIAFLSYRGTAGSSAANMTQVYAYGGPRNLNIYAATVTTAGTFSTSLHAPGRTQQWVHGIVVLRKN